MEKSSFFNSVSHDRTYKAEDWAEYFASFIGNGVFPVPSTGLQVVANDGMKLNVKTGKAWINGYFYFNTGDLAVELDTADGQLNRIDRVVVRWDLTNRVMSVKVKSSSFSASPTAPALQRDADVYELALADIYVGAGVTAITQSKITDQRLNTSICGVVAAVDNYNFTFGRYEDVTLHKPRTFHRIELYAAEKGFILGRLFYFEIGNFNCFSLTVIKI